MSHRVASPIRTRGALRGGGGFNVIAKNHLNRRFIGSVRYRSAIIARPVYWGNNHLSLFRHERVVRTQFLSANLSRGDCNVTEILDLSVRINARNKA